MGKKRRPSPTDEDFRRVAEAMNGLYPKDEIFDKKSFTTAYKDYFEDASEWRKSADWRDAVFKDYQEIRGVELFEEIAPQVPQRKIRAEVTKMAIEKRKAEKHEFKYVGRRKGKVVYAYKSSIKVKGKSVSVYRDRQGKFVRVKK